MSLNLQEEIQEASALIDQLIKAEEEKIAELKKNEESSKEKSKEESKKEKSSKEKSKEEMQKDEDSPGYENQAPEASDDNQAPMDNDDQSQDDEHSSLGDMVQGLDDSMLQELAEACQAEMSMRQGGQDQQDQDPSHDPAPEMDQSAQPDMQQSNGQLQMSEKMAKNEAVAKEKLSKAEAKIEELQKNLLGLSEVMTKIVNRPVTKAVANLSQVQYVDKGGDSLKKSENDMTSEDLYKKDVEVSKDSKKLGNLSKKELDTLSDFLVKKQKNQEIVNIILK